MIPKIIHYCWFGNNPLPEDAVKCINSWKKFFPDYEIKQWNESNFDVNECQYISEAYANKKWAFVSDYARFKILDEFGGLYFDTDVEVIASFDDIIDTPFIGRESTNGIYPAATGLGFGSEAANPLIKEILDSYENDSFLNEDGSLNLTTVVDRTTRILSTHGFTLDNSFQIIEGVKIYPSDYFGAMDYETGIINKTENTKSIHWYTASWLDEASRKRNQTAKIIKTKVKGKAGDILSKLYYVSSVYLESIFKGDFKTIASDISSRIHKK